MRRPNRNIEIFSLSVLDLFSAAMGAFIIIAIILFPNYLKTNQAAEQARAATERLAKCTADLDSALKQSSSAQSVLRQCQAALASTFIVVVMDWPEEGFDVDLHVVDPAGRSYFWMTSPVNHRRQDGSPAELSYDNQHGPGVELWQDPDAVKGTYCVAYNLYNFNAAMHPGGAIKVTGKVFFRNGATPLPEIMLSQTRNYAQVASLVLTADGTLSVHPNAWECPAEPVDNIHAPTGDLDSVSKGRL